MFQDLGPISMSFGGSPRVAWRICFSFYRRISVWNFMQNLRVNIFSKPAMSQDLGPIPCQQEGLQGWPNTFAFLSIVRYQFWILHKPWGSTFSWNWWCFKTWDQFHVIRRVYKSGLTHLHFFISSNISLEFYAKFEGQRFLETGDVSRPRTNSMWLGGTPRVA